MKESNMTIRGDGIVLVVQLENIKTSIEQTADNFICLLADDSSFSTKKGCD